jgi:hypothetical protein
MRRATFFGSARAVPHAAARVRRSSILVGRAIIQGFSRFLKIHASPLISRAEQAYWGETQNFRGGEGDVDGGEGDAGRVGGEDEVLTGGGSDGGDTGANVTAAGVAAVLAACLAACG